MSESVKILAIESSCDETAAAVVENGRRVLSDVISTQVPVHRLYGGVVPEIASRRHLEMIRPVCEEALREAGLTLADIDAIAVTHGPGLVGALLVGVSYAKALAFAANKPLIAVHHWQAHMAAAQIEHDPPYPYLSLIVSGSHSGIALMDEQGCHIIGESHD
ncbi:MAG: tRNA (adenosine(37)-N6)-threonylcarbamoyltransferase complex transferase subunit TsaD, partial [Firmicutes bacterium]|nr:tRNA (adenosine(37)-N6)-threonylcarbamoyltransferase complex transferase subunit TsaD [Bacillota bacterium]